MFAFPENCNFSVLQQEKKVSETVFFYRLNDGCSL